MLFTVICHTRVLTFRMFANIFIWRTRNWPSDEWCRWDDPFDICRSASATLSYASRQMSYEVYVYTTAVLECTSALESHVVLMFLALPSTLCFCSAHFPSTCDARICKDSRWHGITTTRSGRNMLRQILMKTWVNSTSGRGTESILPPCRNQSGRLPKIASSTKARSSVLGHTWPPRMV